MLLKHRHFEIPEGEPILLDKHGKPVLDKDGHPVFIEKELGDRPIAADLQAEELGALPPDSHNRDNGTLDKLPPSADSPSDPQRQDTLSLPDRKDRTGEGKEADPLASLLNDEVKKQPDR
ncbi:MAG: hypothetical protein II719_07875 [Clostridia bacterium]|nr:hypothetical protein [Clostridia bacterium]